MAHLPFLLQQSMAAMDNLQATMEEVRPLMWFTAGLFVLTLLLSAILIFRKQNKHKNKPKTPSPNGESPVKDRKDIKTEEKETLKKEEVIHRSAAEPNGAETPSEPKEPVLKSLKETGAVESPPKDLKEKSINERSSPTVHTTKEEVSSLVDDALKKTKTREENLEAIKKRLEELAAAKPEIQKTTPPSPEVLEVASPPEIGMITKDGPDDAIEEAEVIYLDAEPMFEPVVQPSEREETVNTEEVQEIEPRSADAVTWSIGPEALVETPKNVPAGSMLPQQIKTFSDWLRDFK